MSQNDDLPASRSAFSVNKSEGIGLLITLAAFSVIMSPIAMSDADPYLLKGTLEEIQSLIPIENSITHKDIPNNGHFVKEIILPDGKRTQVTVHLKITPSLPEDASYSPNLKRQYS